MTVPAPRPLAASVAAYAGALLIIGASFTAYARQFSPIDRWGAYEHDPADYRFVAEYFWKVPFHPATYDPIWHGGWGDYLRVVPFRNIGLGSLYLLVGGLRFGHAPSTTAEVVAAGITFAYFQKASLAAALLILFTVVRRRWGPLLAFYALVVTAFPPHFWRISDDFLTEPVHRVLFLLALACSIAIAGGPHLREHRFRPIWAFALVALLLVAAHLKVQWYVAALLLLPSLLMECRRSQQPLRLMLLLCVASLLVPLSVVAVNWIGWRTTALTPGLGLHVNLRYNGAVLRDFSAMMRDNPDRPAFADPARPKVRWWNIYVGPDVTRRDYAAFDRFAGEYVRNHPGSAIRAVAEGLEAASSVPGVERVNNGRIRLRPMGEPYHTMLRVADVAIWLLLPIGLLLEKTRLPCTLALVLWIVPALGNIASNYELRYHLPMAGAGAMVAGCVVVDLRRRLSLGWSA